MLWSRDSHIESSEVSQETKSTRVIASHTVKDDDVLLSSLKSIHSVTLDCVLNSENQLSAHRPKNVFQSPNLTLVGSDNSDLALDVFHSTCVISHQFD
jgi:hypothetical protein